MYNFKKLLCLILAVSTILSCFSVAVHADETEGENVLLTAPLLGASGEETTEDTVEAPADDVTKEETVDTTEETVVEVHVFETVSEEEALATMEKVATNGVLELYLATADPTDLDNEKYINLAVKNTQTGEIWFTNPVNAKDDPYVTGSLKLQQQAQVWVTYVDAKNQSANANSIVASVNRGTYEITKIENGVKIVYDFSRDKEGFKIPVVYSISDDNSFKAEIIVNEIEEYSTQRIMSISLIPHFGAGSIEDEGYLFIPDGSGAIINFNNGQGHRTEYSRPVYGRDQSVTMSVNYTIMQQQVLPVFGIVNNGAGFVAVIEGSDADVNASPSSPKRSAHNCVYASFDMRKKDSYTMNEGNWDAKMLTLIAQMPFDSANFSVEYFFLEQDDVSYSGMAREYRQYLVDVYGFSKKTFDEEMPLYMEVYGAVTKNGNFLGVPTKETVAMTTYGELANMLKEAAEVGITNTVVDYVGWQKGGPNVKVPTNLKYESKLGGKSGYQQLMKVAEELNSTIFNRVEFVYVEEAGNGYSKSSLVAKSAGRTPIQKFIYSLGSGTKNTKATTTFLVSTGLYDGIFEKFSKNFTKLGLTNLSFESLGNVVYSDFRTKEYYDIDEQVNVFSSNIAELKEEGMSLLMNQPNEYAMVYADYLSNVASFSSQFLIADYAVPFVQTLLHGWVSYSSPAISESGDIDEAFLKTIETGSSLMFIFTAKETSQIRDSGYNFLYASDYSIWLDTAADMYKKVNEALGDLQDVEIQNHRRVQDEVFETVYADGTSIVVNYSDNDVDVDGRLVKSMSYDVKKGGN